MIRNIFGRILSVASALAIVFTAYPPVIFADDGGLCPHHPEHTAECGYVEGASPCNFVCEICNPPEVSDSTEPSDAPEPEVTTSPEEQPTVTTAPEPEPAETVTTETMPEESETMPTEPLPEPNFSPFALNDEHVEHDNITDWQAWDDIYNLPKESGNYYLTTNIYTYDTTEFFWTISDGKVINLCLNGNELKVYDAYPVMISGNLTVYDCGNGKIIQNGTGAPINVESTGSTFTLQSGLIESDGNGISTDSNSTVTINGGKISAQQSAIYARSGTIIVNGGVLTGTNYGIEFSPRNSELTNIISLSGDPTIEGGLADIYLHDGAKITVDSQLTATDISIKMETPGVFATGAGAAASVDCFTSADPKYAVRATSDGQLELVEVHRHADGKEFTAWTKNNELPTEPGDYYLTQNVTVGNILQLSGEVSICLNGHKIDCGGSGCLFVNGGSLTIYDDPDKEGEITGSGIAFIQCQGKVIINSGKISHSSGKPIFVTGSGNLTINGGEIIGSSTGVEVQGGTLIVNGGTIKSGGTTIIFDSYANVIINGGIIQSTNSSAVTNYGNTSGKLTIHGGEFTAGDNAQVVVLLNSDNGNITLSGSPTFSGGKVDISLSGTAKIEFDGDLGTPNIKFDAGYKKSQAFTLHASDYGITKDRFTFIETVNYSNPDDEIDYEVQQVGGELWLVPLGVHMHEEGATFDKAWNSNNSLPDEAGNYYLTTDVTLEDTWSVKNGVKLCLNGYDIICGEHQIQVGSSSIFGSYSGSLSVYDCAGGGEISGESSVIYIESGNFTLYGGKISSYGELGSALYMNDSVTIYGGEVTSQNYDGISLMDKGNLTVSGGIISGKQYAVDITSNIYGSFTLSGNPKLDGQTADIYTDFRSSMTIKDLSTSEVYTVWHRSSSGTFATVESGLAADYVKNFISAKYGYDVVADGEQLKLVEKHIHDGVTFERWSDAAHLPEVAGNYCLETDVNLSEIWSPKGDVSICLNGHTIDYSDKGNSAYIMPAAGATLSIYDCKDTGEIKTSYMGIQNTNSDATLIIYGGKIINTQNDTITSRGTVIINGGEITSTGSGASGIYAQGGSLIVNDGDVYKINFAKNTDVKILGGTITSNSTAVYFLETSSGKLTVHGGDFTAGHSSSYGINFSSNNSNLILSGNPTFSGGQGGIQLGKNAKIEFDGKLETTEPIKIDVALKNQAFTIGAGENGVRAEQFEYVGDDDYEVQKVGTELWLVPEGAHVHEDSQMIFDKRLDRPGTLQSGNYYLIANIYTEEEDLIIPEGAVVNLCLNNRNLLQTDGCVRVKGTLNIYDCGSSPSNEIDSNGVAIVIEQGGNVTLYDGHLESQYDIHEHGGGIAVTNAGVLTIVGGDIQGDITSIENTGTLNLEGGTVSGKIDTAAGTCNITGSPTVTDVIKVSSDHPLGIAEALTNDTPLKISMDDPGVFATGEGAVDSIGCFNLTAELESAGYEIAAVDGTLVARLKTYTITYAPGEGSDISGNSFTETKTHGKEYSVSDELFTRPGYTQTGWKTADGVKYDFGENYRLNAELTLYPVWEKNEIHFYVDGKEATGSLSLKVGESAEISVKITPESAVCGTIQWTAESGISINPNTRETVTVTGDSAGEFELTATTDGGLTTKTLIVTVSRNNSNVSAENQTVIYGDDVTITAKIGKAATNGISLMANYDNKVTFKLGDTDLGVANVVGDTATLTIPVTRANGFAIGDNTVTLEYSGSGELEHAEGSVTVTVNKKTLTATITGTTTKTYDGTTSADGLELKITGVVEGDSVSASAEFAYDSANAGERTISATNAKLDGEHAGYYELSTPISTYGTISPLPAELVWTGDEFAYDGNSHKVTVTVENAVGGDEFKLTYTGNAATETGDYTAKVIALGNTNYTLSGATGIEHKWKITALSLADAQIEIVGSYTYNGEVQTPEIIVTLGGKELSTGDYTVAYSGKVKNANTYTVTLTGTGNYSGSASAEFEIAPKSLTASISGTLSKVYDGTTGVNDDVKIALTGVIGTDNVTATADFSYDSVNAGARKIVAKNITLSGKDAKNYTISSKQAEASGSITPAPITLPDSSFIYGGEAKTIIQVGGIEETVTATLTAFSSDAGEYEYSETAKEGGYTVELSSENYKVQSAGTLTIKPLVAVIKWQGGEFTYDGTVHKVTATVKNAVSGDKFEVEYTGNTATEAGDYAAKVTALGNANYTLSSSVECEWKIAPRVAEIEWVGNEFTYDGKSHTVTATVGNAVAGDKFEIAYTGNTATEAGNYTAKVTALGNANYTLSGATGIEHKWKITAASQAAPEVKIDFINETLSTDEAMEFSVDGKTWQNCSAAMSIAKTGWIGEPLAVMFRYKKDVDHIEGEIQSLVIPARRAAPDISEAAVSKSQTEISIAEIPGCEYSLDGATWQDSGVFGGLDKGETYEIFVRYKATASAFASFGSSKTVVTSSTADGTTELLPGETVVAGDGSIKNLGGEIIIDDGEGNETVITLPSDGSVEVDEQGNVIVPDGGTVTVGDNAPVALPDGGSVETDGTVTADEAVIGDITVKGDGVTVTPDGEITLPEGGSVEVDGEAVKIVPKGATVVDGEINAPAIVEPADGEGSIGDGIILSIESSDELLKDNDRENLKEKENSVAVCAYDIKLLKNGEEIQPSEAIKLTVAASADSEKMKVFRLESDGTFTDMDAEFGIGSFSFITEHLSVYVLASEEGEVSSEVVVSDGAPEIGMSDEDMKALEDEVLTDEDLSAIENGDNVKVVMTVDGLSEEEVSEDELTAVEEFMGGLPDYEVAEYADITLTKITEDGVTGKEIKNEAIAEISKPIKLIFDVPEELYKSGRIFSVIRLHDGAAELLDDTDDSDETVTVLTDKFSLYVLIYRDPVDKSIHRHSFTAWINVGASGHLARCAICGEIMAFMPHTFMNGVCTACGYSAIFSQPFDDSDVIEIEVPTEGMIAYEEVVVF